MFTDKLFVDGELTVLALLIGLGISNVLFVFLLRQLFRMRRSAHGFVLLLLFMGLQITEGFLVLFAMELGGKL